MADGAGRVTQTVGDLLRSRWLILDDTQDACVHRIAKRFELLFRGDLHAEWHCGHADWHIVGQECPLRLCGVFLAIGVLFCCHGSHLSPIMTPAPAIRTHTAVPCTRSETRSIDTKRTTYVVCRSSHVKSRHDRELLLCSPLTYSLLTSTIHSDLFLRRERITCQKKMKYVTGTRRSRCS